MTRKWVPAGLMCALLGYVIPLPVVRWLLFLAAIHLLRGERRELLLLRPLAGLEILWGLVQLALLRWPGLVSGLLFLELLATAAELYFHFQFLGDLAALTQVFPPVRERGDESRGRRALKVWELLFTACLLLSVATLAWPGLAPVYRGLRLVFYGTVLLLVCRFLGDMMAVRAEERRAEGDLGDQIRGLRTFYILAFTAGYLLGWLPDGELGTLLLFRLPLLVLNFYVVLSIDCRLFQLWWDARQGSKGHWEAS